VSMVGLGSTFHPPSCVEFLIDCSQPLSCGLDGSGSTAEVLLVQTCAP
jgi:hypothetical protein